jgi:diguanylate cyclase (GGDEF)-like protein
MDLIQRLLDGSLMPHGHCLLWRGDLLFMHVGGDILTTLAYFTIPILLIRLVKKRDDLAFDRIFLMFAAFIFLCGVTHLISLINVWHGYYFIEGIAKISTGVVSALTAIVAWRLLPIAISIPSRARLVSANEQLRRAREEILEANSRLEQKVQERTAQLEALAVADPLTGTYRRTYALDTLGNELKRAQRYNTPLAVAMIDIDDFKRINDTHGHLAGDDVLRGIGSLLNTLSRESDTIGRFGGEEFLIVMPECDQTQAVLALERFNKALREHRFTLTSGETLRVTCSIGTTQATGETSQTELLANADKALYQAKHEGKDRVVSC